jgi:hypothetical protein
LELNYFEADSGLYIPAASRLRDTAWASQTCTLGEEHCLVKAASSDYC